VLVTNVPDLISDLQIQCPPSTSDHNVVKFDVNVWSDSNASDNQDIVQSYYDFSSGDYEAIESYLMNFNWSNEFTFVFCVEHYWQIFDNRLNTAIEAYDPVKESLFIWTARRSYALKRSDGCSVVNHTIRNDGD